MAYLELECQRNTETTMSSLPPELLLIIFEFCYEDFRRDEEDQPNLMDPPWHYISGGLDQTSMRPAYPSKIFDRFRSPSRFPFALAAVSTLWGGLLLREQKYWTEIIYTIGSCVTAADIVKMINVFECFPRHMPLDFVILKERPGSKLSSAISEMEHTQLCTIAASYLNNHFPSLRSLAIEGYSGSSFPDIMGGWRYRATNAETVLLSSILLFRETDYIYQGRKYPRFQSFDQGYHSLNTLLIHGLNLDGFYPSLLNGQISNLEQLVISDYIFWADGLSFTDFLHVITILPHLCRLKLQNIRLTCHPGNLPSILTCNILQLHLESMTSFTTTELYRLCDFPNIESLHFTKCTYHECPSINELLILEDVDVDPLSTSSFENELGEWGGSTLWIGGYRGPCQSLLDVFRKYNEWTNDFRCPWMDTLYLYRIPDLSLKRLKKMLKTRNRGVNYRDLNWRTNTSFGPPLRKLSIDQCGIAPLTEKDLEWFSSMLVEFVYIPLK